MAKLTKVQFKLALKLAQDIEHSGCDISDIVTVLSEHIAALLGRHAPDQEQLIIALAEVNRQMNLAAGEYFRNSDIYPNR